MENFELQLKNTRDKEQEKAEIELLENFLEKYSVTDYKDRASLILAYLEERPAALVSFSLKATKNEENNFLEKIDREKKYIEEFMEKLNIKAALSIKKPKDGSENFVFIDLYVSKDQEKMVCLKNAFKSENEKEIGLALGYPESAADAFANDTLRSKISTKKYFAELSGKEYEVPKIDWKTKNFPLDEGAFLSNNLPEAENLSDKKRKEYQELIRFSPFKPSKDNWQEELETVRSWSNTIKEKSPDLYEKIIKNNISKVNFDTAGH